MKYYKKLCGKHIYLSPMNVEDAEQYVTWLSNAEMTDRLGQTANVIGLESEKEWIAKNSSEKEFAIVLNDSDLLIGNCGFNWTDPVKRSGEIGIFIGDKENRGKGYGAEAVRLLLEFGFNVLNLHSICLTCFSFNGEAAACYKKCGFSEAGRKREASFCNGKYCDVIIMDILENEFRKEIN
jgi:RimJ/RimL family protein N-acetyltransferase